ncbi:ADP-forming succinate--CoA ligase subunit beta [Candidatus Bathyarchaeota archaeon]|nr:ADP-forming succinate--CoA ligase subunit beta [Candidatus Bathyarchaeota archaeon]
MKLFEYEAKEILGCYGIKAPKGGLAKTPDEAFKVATKINPPYAIKAQLLVSGRGKAGGILFADSPLEVKEKAARLLDSEIKGSKVKSVWIEEKIAIKKEVYFGITVDRAQRSYVAIASSEGGIDIEEVAATTPEKVTRFLVDPIQGFRPYHARQIAKEVGYKGRRMLELAAVFHKIYRAAMDYDAELIETNPLAETMEGTFIAVDARLIIDDNALYRHPEFQRRLVEDFSELTREEIEARKSGLAYVKMDGNIGVVGNGAGLVMATLDLIQLYGGKPADFLDVGGGASSDKVEKALNIVLSDPNVEVAFINILGGITRCDQVARGIVEARRNLRFRKPIVIRLVGTNEDEGKRILTEEGIQVFESMEEAAKKAVEIAEKGGQP